MITAQALRDRRRAADLTQEQLARATGWPGGGVAPVTISKLERGKHSPTMRTVDQLMRALDLWERGPRP